MCKLTLFASPGRSVIRWKSASARTAKSTPAGGASGAPR
jgi:hypothetical protein